MWNILLIRKNTGRRHDVLSNRAHAVLRKGLLRAASSRPSARAGFHVPKFGEVAQGCWLNAAHRIREQVQLSRHADFDDEYMRLFRTPKVGPTCLRCRTKQKEMRHTLLFGCQGTSLRCTHLTLADVQASQVVRRTGSSSSPGLRRRRRRFCCGGCCCCCCCGGDICVRASLTFSLRQGVGKMIPGERFGWLKTRPRWRGEKRETKKTGCRALATIGGLRRCLGVEVAFVAFTRERLHAQVSPAAHTGPRRRKGTLFQPQRVR